jgi:shikimate kinase
MKVFIIGYMGSGKSSIGQLLAKKLNYKFTDLDNDIEIFTGCTVSEIFNNEGEEKFREYEKEALERIRLKDEVVIATGGGTPCYFNNMNIMNTNGITVYLKANAEILYKRVFSGLKKRPLLDSLEYEDIRAEIKKTLLKREGFYLKAKIVIDTDNLSEQQVISYLMQNREFVRSLHLS